jgi:hypothetical protein
MEQERDAAYVTLSGQCPMEQMMKEFGKRTTQS